MVTFFDKHPGWGIASRVAAAVLGGYALSSAWVVLWGAMQSTRVEAILAGVQTSFVVYTVAAIWAFSPVALRRVWGVLIAAVVAMLGSAVVLAGWRG